MFKFFNFKKENRQNALEPKNLNHWISHMISELIGSIWISMGLAGLSMYIHGREIEKYFLFHAVIVGFFAGFIVVGSCLLIFGRWSVDLNPAVSLYRWIAGTNTGKYVFYKVIFQIMGGMIAGLIIYAIGHNFGSTHVPDPKPYTEEWYTNNFANKWISAAGSYKNIFNTYFSTKPVNLATTPNSEWYKLISGSIWIFFGELILTAILLFPIFSPRVDSKYRDLFIVLIISFDVWMGILLGSAAINAIRGFAQQAPTLFFDMYKLTPIAQTDIIMATVAMLLGDILAPFFYALVQGFTEKYFNIWLVKGINFKNNRHTHYINQSQKSKK